MNAPLDLLPGQALGPFALGATLFSVLNHVRRQRDAHPAAKLAWDDENPARSDINLLLTSPPLALLFESSTQRLTRIEVTGEAGSWAAYRGKSLRAAGAEEEEDAVKTVRRVMGPTYNSGKASREEGEEVLSYPGVAFAVERRPGGASSLPRIILTPLPSPPKVSVDQAWLHPVLSESPAAAEGELRSAEIILGPNRQPISVALHFHSNEGTPIPPVTMKINETTSEDLFCDLGSPVRTFYKEDDRMSIHTSRSAVDPDLQPNPYFVSHPHLGLTFLLHPTKPKLLKIIFHSNLPGEVNFGRTSRCAWELVDSTSDERRSASEPFKTIAELLEGSGNATRSTSRAIPGSDGLHSVNDGGGGSRVGSVDSNRSGSPASVGSKTGAKKGCFRAVDVEQPPSSSGAEGREPPMTLDRTADGGEGPVKGKTTEIHGFPGIVFEVTSSGDVETVWLF